MLYEGWGGDGGKDCAPGADLCNGTKHDLNPANKKYKPCVPVIKG